MQDVFAECTISQKGAGAGGTGGNTDNGFDISVLLTTGEGNDSCQMVLSLTGSQNKIGPIDGTEAGDGTNTVKTSTTTNTYTWTAKDIIYGDQERTVEEN